MEVYYDNIKPHGQSMDEVWDDILRTIACLSKRGSMIILTKSSLLVTEAKLLGFDVSEGSYQLGEKALKRPFGSKIPTNLKELQGLLGRLNFVSGLIPQLKQCIKPIERLLRTTSDAKWTIECMEVLNDLFNAAALHMRLELHQPNRPIQVHYSKGKGDCEVVLT